MRVHKYGLEEGEWYTVSIKPTIQVTTEIEERTLKVNQLVESPGLNKKPWFAVCEGREGPIQTLEPDGTLSTQLPSGKMNIGRITGVENE